MNTFLQIIYRNTTCSLVVALKKSYKPEQTDVKVSKIAFCKYLLLLLCIGGTQLHQCIKVQKAFSRFYCLA